MNGLTAKRLRQLAHAIVLSQGESPGKDANLYNQESNCISWEPAYEDGHRHTFDGPEAAFVNALHPRAKDPDGNPLLGMFHNPGTLHHANKTRVIYNHLKKLWKQTGGNHEIFGKRFRRIVNTYAEAAHTG
jgi:hypothetical protein